MLVTDRKPALRGHYVIPLWDEVDKTPGGAVKRTVTYYPVAGATPALQRTQCGASVRINTVGGSNSVYYILKDHLGSASVVTDSTGTIVSGSEQRYHPYGESRLTGTMLTDKLFTGQRDVGLGIYHYGARFYSPKLGRFLSADTIVPSFTNPQHLNRYMYVLGNPLKYTDPTGHAEWDEDDGGCYPCTQWEPVPQPEPEPEPEPDDDEGEDDCPDWNVCVNDVSSGAMADFWTDNNEIIDLWDGVDRLLNVGGLGSIVLGYLAGQQPASLQSALLILSFGTVVITSAPLLVGVGIGMAVSGLLVDTYTDDLQEINNAISQSGALTGGGSIVADWDGATVTGPAGTVHADTTLPFVAHVSLWAWAELTPGIIEVP